jgi:hypothetical protein
MNFLFVSGVILANASLDIAFHDIHLVTFSKTFILFILTVCSIKVIEDVAAKNNDEYIKMF